MPGGADLEGAKPDKTISVSLGSSSGTKQHADLMEMDDESGLALVKVDGNIDYVSFKISREEAQLGDPVTVMGYPTGRELTLLLGNVTSLHEPGGRIATSVAAPAAGLTGSPVLNKRGDVIAVMRGHYEGELGTSIATPIQVSSGILTTALSE